MAETIVAPETGITRKIKKAKLNSNFCVDVEFEEIKSIEVDGSDEPVEIKGIVPYKGKNIVHQDLIDAFEMFKSHLAFIAETAESVNISFHDLDENEDILKRFSIDTIELSSAGSSDSVKIIGSKELKDGDFLPLKTPFISLISIQDEGYMYADELNATVVHWYNELELYINKGKIAPSAQMNLFDSEDHDIEE